MVTKQNECVINNAGKKRFLIYKINNDLGKIILYQLKPVVTCKIRRGKMYCPHLKEMNYRCMNNRGLTFFFDKNKSSDFSFWL